MKNKKKISMILFSLCILIGLFLYQKSTTDPSAQKTVTTPSSQTQEAPSQKLVSLEKTKETKETEIKKPEEVKETPDKTPELTEPAKESTEPTSESTESAPQQTSTESPTVSYQPAPSELVEQPSEPTPVEQPIQPAPIEQPSVPEPQPEPVQPEPAPQPDGYWYEGRLISNSTPLGNSGRIWFYDTYGGEHAAIVAMNDYMEEWTWDNNVTVHYFGLDVRDAYTGEVIGKTVNYKIIN